MASKSIIQDRSFNIVASLSEANTFYIFRESGVEIKIVLEGRKIFTTFELTPEERKYVNKKILGDVKAQYRPNQKRKRYV